MSRQYSKLAPEGGFATGDELLSLARDFGTPSFVFELGPFRRRLREVGEAFGPEVGLCYSIKANPFLARAAAEEGLKLEVCSPGELSICESLGIDPQAIVYSGVCKREDDVREALAYGVGVFTAESRLQFELVERCAAEAGKVVPVLLRLNGGSQFGMSLEDLTSIVDERQNFPATELVGIHYFVGTQRRKLKHQARELQRLEDLLDELERGHGWRPRRLEYGPGLAVPLFEGEDFQDTLAPARQIAQDLRRVAGKVELTVEMGRFFATECGSYLTGIVDLKSNEGTHYAFVDGGMNHVTYLGQMMGMKLPVIQDLSAAGRGGAVVPGGPAPLGPATSGAHEWSLCGSLCTTADVLVRSLPMDDLRMGDVLALRNLGAYSVTEGIHLFLSRTMPRVLLVEEDGSVTIARDWVQTSVLNTPSTSHA